MSEDAINCKYCSQQITFNDKITSERGKKDTS